MNHIKQKFIMNARNKTEKLIHNEIIINIGNYCWETIEKNIYDDEMIPKYSNEMHNVI